MARSGLRSPHTGSLARATVTSIVMSSVRGCSSCQGFLFTNWHTGPCTSSLPYARYIYIYNTMISQVQRARARRAHTQQSQLAGISQGPRAGPGTSIPFLHAPRSGRSSFVLPSGCSGLSGGGEGISNKENQSRGVQACSGSLSCCVLSCCVLSCVLSCLVLALALACLTGS